MNELRLTDLGKQAANNASAGGIHIAPIYFKVGDSTLPHDNTRQGIYGNTLYQGDIHYVEVLSGSSTRFAFYIPPHVPPVGGLEINEVGIFLDDNVMFARCVFDEPYVLEHGEGTRVNAILATTECDLSVIDVTIGNYSSIPQTSSIRQLPNPSSAEQNVISVLDLLTNPDGSSSPGMVMRFGQGSAQWAFLGYERVYTGVPDAGASPSNFCRASITSGETFYNGERVIAYIVSGPGIGETRKFEYSSSTDCFSEVDGYPYSGLDETSTISIWKKMSGGSGGVCCYGYGSGGSSGDTVETVTNYINAVPAYAVGDFGVDSGPEAEILLTSGVELPDTNNRTFTINIPTSSGDVTTNLWPIYGTDSYGMTSTASVDAWVASSNSVEIQNGADSTFTVDATGPNTYGYFLIPEEFGPVTFVDVALGLPGGWDGAGWPQGGLYDGSISGPIDVVRMINGVATNWKLYRMDFPDVGEKTFDYNVQNDNANPQVTGNVGSGSTKYGYFIYPVNLGLATFTDVDDNSTDDWNGADWAQGETAGTSTGPITITRNLGDNPSNWYLYRTNLSGEGTKTYSVVFENAGTVVQLPDGTIDVVTPGTGSGNPIDGDCSPFPPRKGIPADWVLHRGEGGLVVWGPQSNGTRIVSTLYTAPGKLKITTLTGVGDGTTRRFNLGGVVLKDANYMFTALGGIYQNRTAFAVQGSELEFAEEIPANVPVDMRMITKEPGDGTFVEFVTDTFITDGIKTNYKLSVPVDGPEYVFVHIRSVLQQTVSYSYSAQTQEIIFIQPPAAGLNVETTALVRTPAEGYSTDVVTQQLITVGDTLFIELPIIPQTKDMTFLAVNGSHIHRELYTIVDNKLILSSAIPAGRDVEVMIFNNALAQGSQTTNLKGVVTDAMLTSKALMFLRHDAPAKSIPIPAVELTSGRGIKITGNHPQYRIESTVAAAFSENTNFKFSTLTKEIGSDEIIYSYRVNITGNTLLTVIADFSAILGPGFVSPEGREKMEYVIGFRTTSAKEPEYGRQIKGTGVAGFSSLSGELANNDSQAYSNASLTQVFAVISSNIPAGYIDVVAKMRIKDAETSKYESLLFINFNVIGTPKIAKSSG